MNVRELIEELSALDPEAEVILQKDPEGNGFETLRGVGGGWYLEDEYFIDEDWTAEDADMEDEEFEEMKTKPKSVVLFP